MKITLALVLISLIFLSSSRTLDIHSENEHRQELEESYLVTFECNSCTEKNKFLISGPEEHNFKAVKFPLKIELKSGEYEMTYWQNRVQQIHLPFDVASDSENIITVKDLILSRVLELKI